MTREYVYISPNNSNYKRKRFGFLVNSDRRGNFSKKRDLWGFTKR